MTRPRWLFLAAAAALLTLAVACGGGKSTAAGGSGSAKSQSLDLATAAQKLLAVQSFRFSGDLKINLGSASGSSGPVSPLLAMLGDINVQGAFVAPGDLEVTLKALDQQVQYVQIGNEAWLNEGQGWKSGQAIDISGIFNGTVPGITLPDVVLNGARTKSETVNGAHTTHYAFDKASLTSIVTSIAGQSGANFNDLSAANLDIWITDAGLPIKMVSHTAGASKLGTTTIDASFDVTDLNSKVTIDRPVP